MRRLLYTCLTFILLFGLTACNTTAPAEAPTEVLETTEKPSVEAAPEEGASHGVFTEDDFLHVEGTEVVNAKGEAVYLRGTNTGGWLVQESWMTPTNGECQSGTIKIFDSRFGEETRNALLDTYKDAFLNEEDLDYCRDMGMSVLRLPFWYRDIVDEEGALLADAFARLDWYVNACGERGLYVILDMHGAPGSQNGNDHSGSTEGALLWTNPENQDLTVKVWEMVAEHYKGNPVVAGYDLLNEPAANNTKTNKTQWDFFDRLYKAIRAKDPDHIQIMESCWSPFDLINPKVYGWENIMYSYHNYIWDADTNDSAQIRGHRELLRNIKLANYGVPVLMGEFTLFRAEEAWNTVLQEYNEAGVHWTTWTLKTTGKNNSWGLLNITGETADIFKDSTEEITAKWKNLRDAQTVNAWLHNIMVQYMPGNPLVEKGTPVEEDVSAKVTPVLTEDALLFNACTDAAAATAGGHASVDIEDTEGVTALRLKNSQTADPGRENGCVILRPTDGRPVDTAGYTHLVFYIKDMQGSNTHYVTVKTEDGGVWSAWVETPSEFKKWVRVDIPLSTVNNGNVGMVTEIRIGMWNAGSYYFSNVFFTAEG